jgi:RNA polymerase sigma-70 factor (ECF subfamily)
VTTDRELVDRVRAGEASAFAVLVERYQRSVLAMIQAELRDPEAAHGVAKTTLLSAYRQLPRLSDGSQFGPWLLRMARRRSIEAVRRMPVVIGGPQMDNGFDSCDLDWIEHEHVLGLVTRLPNEERQLIGLRYFDNHSLAEIAELQGLPVEQVSRQLSMAVMRLQYWWTREQES